MKTFPVNFSSRSIAWIAIAGPAVVLLIGSIHPDPFIEAKEPTVQRPRWVTTFQEVHDGDVVHQVPVTRQVFDHRDVQVFQNVAAAWNPLPHEEEIHSLLQKILGSAGPDRFQAPNDAAVPSEDTEPLKSQLQSMLGDQFDAMSQRQQDQIKELSERLEKLKSQHQARSEARDEIIDRRMNELLRRPDPLAWDPYASQRYSFNSLFTPFITPSDPAIDLNRGMTGFNPGMPGAGAPIGAPINGSTFNGSTFNGSAFNGSAFGVTPGNGALPAPTFQDTKNQAPRLPDSSLSPSHLRLRSTTLPQTEPSGSLAQQPTLSTRPTLSTQPLLSTNNVDILNELYTALGQWSVDKSDPSLARLRSAHQQAKQRLQQQSSAAGEPDQSLGDRRKITEQLESIDKILESFTADPLIPN